MNHVKEGHRLFASFKIEFVYSDHHQLLSVCHMRCIFVGIKEAIRSHENRVHKIKNKIKTSLNAVTLQKEKRLLI